MKQLGPFQCVIMDGTTPAEGDQLIPEAQALELYQGEDVQVNLEFVGQNGSAINITGWAIALGVRNTDTSAEAWLSNAGSVVSGVAGTAKVIINDVDTSTKTPGVYRWAIRAVNTSAEDYLPIPASPFQLRPAPAGLGDAVASPGPDMYLVGVPAPESDDVGKFLSVTDDDPITLGWTSNPAEIPVIAADDVGKVLTALDDSPQSFDWQPLPASGIIALASNTALRASTAHEDTVLVFLRGYEAANDGGARFMHWNEDSEAEDNDGTVIKPDAIDGDDPGRWEVFSA